MPFTDRMLLPFVSVSFKCKFISMRGLLEHASRYCGGGVTAALDLNPVGLDRGHRV
ncbi:MAG: hypothetical protein ACPGPS_20060 [Rubripirellula sp.]